MKHWEVVLRVLLSGAEITVIVSAFGIALAIVFGYLLAVLREFAGSKTLGFLISAYCEFFRNIPVITHLFIIYFGLAEIGIKLTSITASIVGFGLIGSAICCDIFSGGFESLGKGQSEAAFAAGLTPIQTIGVILTPQAFRISLPPLVNYSLQLMKDTSVVSAIAAPEIVFRAQSMNTILFQPVLIFSSAAALYLILSLPIVWASGQIERQYAEKGL